MVITRGVEDRPSHSLHGYGSLLDHLLNGRPNRSGHQQSVDSSAAGAQYLFDWMWAVNEL